MSQPTVNIGDKAPATLGGVFPILRVADLEASLRYYETQLGFEVQWRSGAVASVQRDRAAIMLCQGDQGHAGTWLWIAVSDADSIYTELQARGAACDMRRRTIRGARASVRSWISTSTCCGSGPTFAPASRWATGSMPQGSDGCRTQVEAGAKERVCSDDSQAQRRPVWPALQEEGSEDGQARNWARSRPGQPP